MSDNTYRRLYPDQENLVFDGGIDTKFEKALIPENESPDCLNVEFYDGTVGTRQGATLLNTFAAGGGGNAFDGLYTRRDGNGTSETMCAFINGSMYTLGTTTFVTVPSAQSVFTIGSRVGCDTAEDYLFIGNGGVGPYKWDGTYFTQHGVSAPVATASVATGTVTGSLTTAGVYQYVYTNVNTHLVESDFGPAITATVGTTSLSVKVGGISVATYPSQGINARYLYRTLAGAQAYYRVAQLNDNVTTSYVDTTSDINLGSPAPVPGVNGTPPVYNAIIYHRNILFVNDVNNPNYVWYSIAGQPYSFSATNFFKVGDKTSDLVKGFASYDNSLIIFCEQSTWIEYMPNPADDTTWVTIRTNSPFGSVAPYAPVVCNVRGQDVLLHPVSQNRKFIGIAALIGQTLDPSVSFQAITTAGSDLQSQVIEPDMFLVPNAYVKNISAIVYKNRAFITLPYGTSATYNNRIYVWDFSMSNLKKEQPASWSPWTFVNINFQQFCIYGGNVYGCSSDTTGFVYRIVDTGVYNDNGQAINSYWWSKEYPGLEQDTALTKDFRYINMLYDNAGSYYMNLTYRTDSDLGVGNVIQVNLTTGGSTWGTMIWGTSMWGGGTSQTDARIYLGGTTGKRLQFKFDNQNKVNQRFKVHRAQFVYNIRGYR